MLITIEMTFFLKKRGKMNGSSRTPVKVRMRSVFFSPVYSIDFRLVSSCSRTLIVTSGCSLSGIGMVPP